jgi:hypothetical protein
VTDRHVVPADGDWHVEKDDALRASAKTTTQAEAVRRATQIVANSGGGHVIVHSADGKVRRARAVEASASKSVPRASKSVPRAVTARAAVSRAGIKASSDTALGEVPRPRSHTDAQSAAPEMSTGATITSTIVADIHTPTRKHAVNQISGDENVERTVGPVSQTTEWLFRPLARGARLLNPLHIAGQTVELTLSAALRATGTFGSRARRHLP